MAGPGGLGPAIKGEDKMEVVESTIIEVEPTERNEVDALPVKYDITNAAINQLRLQYAGLEIIDKPSYKAIVAAIADVRGRRTSVEKRRKELKAGALDYGRRVDGEAKRITELLEAIEEPLKEKKLAEDSKETKRITHIQGRIEAISKMVPTVPTSSDALSEIIFDLDTMEIGADFEEFREHAESVRAEASAKINQMISDRLKWEDEEKSRQEELSMLEAIKAENSRIEAERKSREEADEKIRRAEREAIEAERRALEAEKAKLETEKRAENDRKEQEEQRILTIRNARYRELESIGVNYTSDNLGRLTQDQYNDVYQQHRVEWDRGQEAKRIEAEEKAARERNEFERIAKEKAEKEAKEKQEREESDRKAKAEAEAAELTRQEALKPDKEKLLDFSYRLESLNISKTTSQGAKILAFEIMDRVEKLINFVRIEVEKL